MHAPSIQTINTFLSGLTLAATALYVVLTHKSIKVSERMVQATLAQMHAQGRPHILVMAKLRAGAPVLQLSISNVGKSTASDLSLVLEPEYRQFHNKKNSPLQSFAVFSKRIATFPPGAELIFDLGVGYQFFQSPENDAISPPRFSVTASYRDDISTFSETTDIDLHMFDHTAASKQGELAELEGIKNAVTKLYEAVRDATRTFKSS